MNISGKFALLVMCGLLPELSGCLHSLYANGELQVNEEQQAPESVKDEEVTIPEKE